MLTGINIISKHREEKDMSFDVKSGKESDLRCCSIAYGNIYHALIYLC